MVVIRPRSSWQDPAKPITGPARRAPFRQGVIHWEGDLTGVPADVAAYLRSMQAAYLRTRNYSLGYGIAAVSQADHAMNGTLWEIRGFDINMASNPGDKVPGNANDWTGSVLIMGRPGEHVTPEAAGNIRHLFADWHTRADTPFVRPLAHSDLDYTACCGDPYRADISAGLFDPHHEENHEDMAAVTPKRLLDQRLTIAGKTLVPCDESGTVFVNVTVVDGTAPGWIYAGDSIGSSIVNIQPDGRAQSCCVPVGSLNGFWLGTTTPCRLIVDLFGAPA